MNRRKQANPGCPPQRPDRRRRRAACLAAVTWSLLLWAMDAPHVHGGLAQSQDSATLSGADPQAFRELSRVVRALIIEALPQDFEVTRDWGQQQPVYAGFEIRREGMRLETKRRWVMKNHGTWRRFTVAAIDPEQHLEVSVRELTAPRAGSMAVKVEFSAMLEWQARQSRWERGVQLYSLSAEGTTTVRLALRCTLETEIDRQSSPPQLVVKPQVTEAALAIEAFRIHRLSKLGGEFAQQATRLAQGQLEARSAALSSQLQEKLNAGIERHRQRWSIPLPDFQGFPDLLSGGLLSSDGWRQSNDQ